jgi:FkbM family methyltransferase
MNVAVYKTAEALLGRAFAWRLGRWLYTGSRRELQNDPTVNGEYALQRAWLRGRQADTRPMTIVDVGANIGDWTASFLAELRQSGTHDAHIWAFEPAPDQRAEIAARLSAYIADGRLRLDPRAVGAAEGRATFLLTGSDTGTSALAPEGSAAQGVETEVTRLDKVFSEAPPMLDFVKVDTEGNDFNVILGAQGLFDAERIGVLQFEYNWRWIAFRHFLKDVFDFAEGRPYRLGRLTAAGVEIYKGWHPELERFIETNYVLLHIDALHLVPHWDAVFDGRNIPVLRPRAPAPAT